MEKIRKRKAKDVLQFIEDKGLSFDIVSNSDGEDWMIQVYAKTFSNRKIHYAIYPLRNYSDSLDLPPRKGYLREAVEFVMDMEEGV
jgi:hypothetical protein